MIKRYLDNLHIPFDVEFFHEFNAESYELAKTGKILFNHPDGTHEDCSWVLAVYAAEQAPPPPSRPMARVI